MYKFTGEMDQGTLYGFGFSEVNLNRLEFNREPILFDFGYAGVPDVFGLILYVDFKDPEEAVANMEAVKAAALPYLKPDAGITVNTLRMFPIVRSVMQQFRAVPFWGFDVAIPISNPADKQLFFAARDEQAIREYLVTNVIPKTPKPQFRGFGKQQGGDRP